MISIKQKFKFLAILFSTIIIYTSCNKDVEQFPEAAPIAPSGTTLGETIAANADDSLYYRLIVTGGLLNTINNKAVTYTMFVPGNNAMKLFINAISGGLVPLAAPDAVFSGFISANISATTAAAIVSYNIVPQALPLASIPSSFPNLQYATIFNPAPSLSDLLRLTTFPSTSNGAWVNNIPISGADINAGNGIIHPTAFLVTPPQRYLWDRINNDLQLTYLKAAILRADSSVDSTSALSLKGALKNIGANLTVFAPTDSAFQIILTGAIFKGLTGLDLTPSNAAAQPVAFGQASFLASTPAVFSIPNLFSVLTAQTVKGIVVYHILGSRAFTNNFPTTPIAYPTLLNGAIPTHPGITLQATFAPPFPFVIAATVKGAYNVTASNLFINASPLIPDPFGTSDQHYLNGVIHKIDQVLIPLPL